jgi:hypothetical protein
MDRTDEPVAIKQAAPVKHRSLRPMWAPGRRSVELALADLPYHVELTIDNRLVQPRLATTARAPGWTHRNADEPVGNRLAGR